MAIITFWSQNKKEIGQTATAIAVATHMAIEHNMKILLLSTEYGATEIERGFWNNNKQKKALGFLFTSAPKVSLDTGVEGLVKAVSSRRLTPEMITNYTKIVFKDRLEVLDNFTGREEEYLKVQQAYLDIIKAANSYYDRVIVDLNKGLSSFSNAVLEISDVIAYGIGQRLETINQYKEIKNTGILMKLNREVLYCGRYLEQSKYNAKNIERYLKVGEECHPITFTNLYSEAMEEGQVADYFLKVRTVKEGDKNTELVNNIEKLSNAIQYRIKMQQMKM